MARPKDSKNYSSCKVCGQLTSNHNGRVTCSPECSEVHRQRSKIEKRIEVECCVCGKPLARYKNELKARYRFACSLECQRQLIKAIDWRRRSMQAKESYKRKRSMERMLANEWFNICRVGSIPKISNLSDIWKQKCKCAARTLNERSAVRKDSEWSLTYLTWDVVARVQYKAAIQRGNRRMKSGWSKKCSSVARNIKQRLSN